MIPKIVYEIFFYFFIIGISLIFFPYNRFINDQILIKIGNDYKLSPIMNLNSNNCSSENSYNILGYFEGIPEGRTYSSQPRTNCTNNEFNYFEGRCKKNPWFNYDVCTSEPSGEDSVDIYYDKEKCIIINEIKGKNFTHFNGIYPICSLKNNFELNYDILIKNSTKTIEECLNKKGMKVCGILDDLNQIACLNENIECPLNDIFIDPNEDDYEEIINGTTIIYKKINIGGNYIHYTNQNFYNRIISGFNISLLNPCSHFYPDFKRFNLFAGYDFIFCSENSNLSETIDNQNAFNFFNINGLTELFQQFDLSKLNYQSFYLNQLHYYGFDKECYLKYSLNSNSFYDYYNKRKKLKIFYIILYISTFFLLCMIFTGLYLIIYFINTFIFLICHLICCFLYLKLYSPLNCRISNKGKLNEDVEDYELKMKISLIYLIFVFLFSVFWIMVNKIKKNHKLVEEINDDKKNEGKEKLQNNSRKIEMKTPLYNN